MNGYKSSHLWAFASPAFCMGALGLPIIMYLPPLYAEIGLELAVVGGIFMVARLWDMVSDPLTGVLGNHWRTRWGRRKPAITVSVPLLLVSVYLVFNPPAGVNATYLLGSMLVLYVGWTLFTLSHAAWASELTGDYHERSRIMGIVEGATLAGAITIVAVPAFMDWTVPGSNLVDKMQVMGAFILVPLPILVILAMRSVPEPPAGQRAATGFRQGVRAASQNAALRRARGMLMRSVMADVIDHDRVATGRERNALFYALLSMTSKLGLALAVGVSFATLDLIGFDAQGENTAASIEGLRWVMAMVPTVVAILFAWIMWHFPLTRARQQALQAEIEGA